MEKTNSLVQAVLDFSSSAKSFYTARDGEAISVYWLSFLASQYDTAVQIPFTNALVASLTLDKRSAWHLKEPDFRARSDQLLREVSTAKRQAIISQFDLSSGSQMDQVITVIGLAAARLTGLDHAEPLPGGGDTRTIAIHCVRKGLETLNATKTDEVRAFCSTLPRQAQFETEQGSSGCLGLALVILLPPALVVLNWMHHNVTV